MIKDKSVRVDQLEWLFLKTIRKNRGRMLTILTGIKHDHERVLKKAETSVNYPNVAPALQQDINALARLCVAVQKCDERGE